MTAKEDEMFARYMEGGNYLTSHLDPRAVWNVLGGTTGGLQKHGMFSHSPEPSSIPPSPTTTPTPGSNGPK